MSLFLFSNLILMFLAGIHTWRILCLFSKGRNKKVSLPATVAWLQRVSDAGDAVGSKLNNIGDSERITPTTNKREMQCALFM